jgi:hypothetical protein
MRRPTPPPNAADSLEMHQRKREIELLREGRALVRQARAAFDAPPTRLSVRAAILASAARTVSIPCERGMPPTPESLESLRRAMRDAGIEAQGAPMKVSYDPDVLLRQADTIFDRCSEAGRLDLMGDVMAAQTSLQQAIQLHGKPSPHFVEDLVKAVVNAINELDHGPQLTSRFSGSRR